MPTYEIEAAFKELNNGEMNKTFEFILLYIILAFTLSIPFTTHVRLVAHRSNLLSIQNNVEIAKHFTLLSTHQFFPKFLALLH